MSHSKDNDCSDSVSGVQEREKSLPTGIHRSLLGKVIFKLDPAIGECYGEGCFRLWESFEEKHGVEKRLV